MQLIFFFFSQFLFYNSDFVYSHLSLILSNLRLFFLAIQIISHLTFPSIQTFCHSWDFISYFLYLQLHGSKCNCRHRNTVYILWERPKRNHKHYIVTNYNVPIYEKSEEKLRIVSYFFLMILFLGGNKLL